MKTIWVCPMCSTSNEASNAVCFVCGYERSKKNLSEKELSSLYANGILFLKSGDVDSAFDSFLKAAEYKYLPACLMLAKCYKDGIGVVANPRKAYEIYLSAAKRNDLDAQYEIANCYITGTGTAINLERAVNWLKKASAQNHFPSMKKLSEIYVSQMDSYYDIYEAIELLERIDATSLKMFGTNDYEAITNIGICYQKLGYRIKAAVFLKKAAKAGNAKAQYYLARCYETGRGVIKSKRKASKWYALAAASGFSGASV